MGTIGIEAFARYGWSQNSLFPIFYASHTSSSLPIPPPQIPEAPLRLLYVGQLSHRKGIDVLMRAVDKQLSGNWRLDIVGRHGNDQKRIVNWAQNHPKVSYLGVWPSSEMIHRISLYDVCLVPSRFDGWGIVTNEAIHAGIGTIVSGATASNELIKTSGAGVRLNLIFNRHPKRLLAFSTQ